MLIKILKKKYGTPLYIYEINAVRNSFKDLKSVLPENSNIYYSMKANPHSYIVRELYKLGAGIEVSSIGEVNIALDSGIPASSILYTGPGKSEKDIYGALEKDIGIISVESIEEYSKISEISKKINKNINFLIRINSDEAFSSVGLAMSGKASKFGMDIESARELLNRNRFCELTKIIGFHFFDGTNIVSEEIIIKNFIKAISISSVLAKEYNLDLKLIDLGGGFSSPFANSEYRPLYEKIKQIIEKKMGEYFKENTPKLIFESGRYLVGDSGSLISTIIDIKRSKGEKFLILDSGINHLTGISASGRIPRIKMDFKLDNTLNYKVIDNENSEEYSIVGPLCTPVDIFGKNINLKKPTIGDSIIIKNVGAYGLTASLIHFLSHEAPVEVVLEDDRVVHVSSIKYYRKELNND